MKGFILKIENKSNRYPMTICLSFMIVAFLCTGLAAAENEKKIEDSYGLDITSRVWKGDLDGMMKRRIVRALVVYGRTSYFVDRGTQRGVSYDALKEFENTLNKKITNKNQRIHMVFIPTSREEGLKLLLEGRADMAAAGVKILPELKDQVDFSIPLWDGVNEIVVSAPSTDTISGLEDLSGKAVFVRKNSAYRLSLESLNERFAKENRKPVRIEFLPESLEEEDILEMVNADLIPLTIVDQYKAEFWKQIHEKIVLYPGMVLREGAQIGWVFRKNTPKLRAAANAFVMTHGKGTLFGNMVFKRYLKNTKYVKNALAESERKKFLTVVDLFQRYGDRFGFDWLLMAAQGYQESRLDQNVRSKVGAIGVMQLLPSTGNSMGAGDIEQLEPNIHAGIKYMRFMMDHYFSGAEMDRLNRGLFALGSYNAGPNAVSRCRKIAAAKGLDPNVWFNHVERVVAERIGQEPVLYVANIYKYYIAYTLFMEQRHVREAAKETIE